MNKKSVALATIICCLAVLFIQPIHIASGQESMLYSDIQSHWAKDTILWATSLGIVNGFPDGTFKPNQSVSEAQFLAMLLRVYDPELQSAEQEHWSSPYYQLALELNYPINADLATSTASITRSDVAELITATQGENYSGNNAIKYVLAHQLANGRTNEKTVLDFHGSSFLTRAEAVTLIKNVAEYGKETLAARPAEASDPNKLPFIPTGDEGKLDLPYKVSTSWIPPHIKSVATDSYNTNKTILEEELGLLRGVYYNPYGGSQIEFSEMMVNAGGEAYIAHITIYNWFGSQTASHDLNKIPYISRELFRFYLPEEYQKLYTIMDDYFNHKDVSTYLNKPFELDGREIKLVKSPYSISIFIGNL